jgi:hypothetical protein
MLHDKLKKSDIHFASMSATCARPCKSAPLARAESRTKMLAPSFRVSNFPRPRVPSVQTRKILVNDWMKDTSKSLAKW